MKKALARRAIGLCPALLLACIFSGTICQATAGAAEAPSLSLGGRIANSGRIVRQIRSGLVGHASAIRVSFTYGSDVLPELGAVVEAWMDAAMAETGNPREGDYIRYQSGGYRYTSTRTAVGDRWRYEIRIVPDYYDYLAQAEETDAEVQRIRRSFGFWPWTSAKERAKRIYGYLCGNVKYDKVHRKNPHYHRRSTAYAALVQGTATCQGYCAAGYRLFMEEGIPCRIVTGTAGEEELHAWLIVRLDGLWYLADPTWDAGQEEYVYCFAGSEDFMEPEESIRSKGSMEPDGAGDAGEAASAERLAHVPGEYFLEKGFMDAHPMAVHGLYDGKKVSARDLGP